MTPRRSTGQPRRPPRRRNNWQLPSGAGQADCRSPPASARVATPTAKSRRGAAQGRRRGPASTDCAKPFFALAGAGQACRPAAAEGQAGQQIGRAMRGMARWRGRTASAGPQWRTTRSLSGGGRGWLIAKFGGGHPDVVPPRTMQHMPGRRRAPRTMQHTPARAHLFAGGGDTRRPPGSGSRSRPTLRPLASAAAWPRPTGTGPTVRGWPARPPGPDRGGWVLSALAPSQARRACSASVSAIHCTGGPGL